MAKSSLTIFAQKLEGKPFELERPPEFDEFEKQAQPGRYVIEYKRERGPKTTKQRGVIFGLMIKSAVEQAEEQAIGVEDLMRNLHAQNIPMGQAITKDYLHALMYVIAPTFDDMGNKVTLSKMNTKQASELFERVRTILAPLGIVIEDPNPDWNKEKSQ